MNAGVLCGGCLRDGRRFTLTLCLRQGCIACEQQRYGKNILPEVPDVLSRSMAYGTLTEAVVVPISCEPWSTTPRVKL